METHFHTVIIGAGPAGASCGIRLQKNGISNCLIDKAVFPREKTCGGLVTNKTLRMLKTLIGMDPDPAVFFCDFTRGVTVFEKTTALAHADFEPGFFFADRTRFDDALVKHYLKEGGTLLEGEAHYTIDHAAKTISFQSGKKLHYQFLVFADGIHSQVHTFLPRKLEEVAFGIEAFVPAEDLPVKSVGLHFGFIKNGYVWVFPKGDSVCVGLGNLYQKGYPYQKTLTDVLCGLGVDPSGLHFHGAFLPYGKVYPQNRLPDEILAVGDAAGFADPISGEGLYYALFSGMAAADALAAADPKSVYQKAVEPICSQIKGGRRLQKIFFTSFMQKRFLHLINGRSRFLKFYLEKCISDYEYSHGHILKLLGDYKRSKRR